MISMSRRAWLPRQGLDRLLVLLREDGRRVMGPTVRDGAIVYDEVGSGADLPAGVNDEQSPGRYRLMEAGDGGGARAFDYASSPMSWKTYTYPASVPIAAATRAGERITYGSVDHDAPRMAYLGVRACDIAALAIHDDVLTGGPYIDEDYADRRGKAFIVAVECARPSGTCFCASMGTGPEVTSGYDIALIELDEGYVATAGSEAGQKILDRLDLDEATSLQLHAALGVGIAARSAMAGQPGVATQGLRDRLQAQLESDGWDEIAERCLACTSCTMVCPTCFCSDVRQTADLLATTTGSTRQWASCFTLDFARVAHGNFRPRVSDRYRQWLTHKFSTWVDQFGMFGCVGCGRCITWCPVGIDVRESIIRVAPVQPPLQRSEKPVPVSANPGRYSAGHHRRGLGRDEERLDDAPHRPARVRLSRAARPVPHARPAGLLGRAHLHLALPRGRGLPDHPHRGRQHARHHHAAAGVADRPARTRRSTPGPSRRPSGGTSSSSPAASACPRCGRSSIEILAHRGHFGRVRLFYGARAPGDLLYAEELKSWAARDDMTRGCHRRPRQGRDLERTGRRRDPPLRP